ncbi:unnamed protein product, partial [Didymodactylos carnosus]
GIELTRQFSYSSITQEMQNILSNHGTYTKIIETIEQIKLNESHTNYEEIIHDCSKSSATLLDDENGSEGDQCDEGGSESDEGDSIGDQEDGDDSGGDEGDSECDGDGSESNAGDTEDDKNGSESDEDDKRATTQFSLIYNCPWTTNFSSPPVQEFRKSRKCSKKCAKGGDVIRWIDIEKSQLEKFIGINIIMGYCKNPSIDSHWPVLKHLYNDANDTTLKRDCELVIEQLSISLFLEAKPYIGRKLLQTIWYTFLERLPINDLETGNLITEHDYYSLVYNQCQKSLLDKMIHVQEELLDYFTSTNDDTNSSQNIILLRSLGYLHYIKSCSSTEENRNIELNYFRKAFQGALETRINSEAQQIRCYLAYALYLCQLERYEEALVLLKTVVKFEYHLFNKDFITIYSIHKPIHSKDIQHLLHIYNAINISTKTYILYLLCRAYKYTNRYIEGCQGLINLIQHIDKIKDFHIGQYLLGQLCFLYGEIERAYRIFIVNLRNEYDLSSIFDPSKTMVIFKASLAITTFLQLNLETCMKD